MFAAVALLVIIATSYIVVRTGAVALMLTGLSAEAASFQAQSAFMGVGFTTRESEAVMGHPVRRRVVRALMLIGYAATATVFASVMTVFTTQEYAHHHLQLALWLLGGLLVLFLLSTLGVVRNTLTRLLEYALTRSGAVQVRDYEELLRVDKGYSVSHLPVARGSWMAGRSLREMRLNDEGVVVLSISRRTGVVLATPSADTVLEGGDKLLCYGLESDLERLMQRPRDYRGESEHKLASQLHQARRTAEETVAQELAEVAVAPEEPASGPDAAPRAE
ncbi:MAG: TrkA C-terminal domain-containing protein [Planctomycetes bacterium]|nr:TrkA C-terminal domain-containing protein [Planctomycetota bacterium]